MTISRAEAERQVRSWGFDHVFTWTDGPSVTPSLPKPSKVIETNSWRVSNAHYPPHQHSGMTTHLVLKGSITYTYPGDADARKETIGPGERWDVDAQRVHEVWVGREGCTYVIGE